MSNIRPLGLGEIIDRSATFWRSHWKALFQIFIGFQLVQFTILKAFQLVMFRVFPAMHGGTRLAELIQSDPVEGMRQMAISGSGGTATILVTLLLSSVASVAACRFAYPRITESGTAPSLGESLRFTAQRLPVTLQTVLLSFAWSILIGIIFMAPGALLMFSAVIPGMPKALIVAVILFGVFALGVGMVLAMLWFILRFVVMSQVIALEPSDSPMALFKRSGELTSGRVKAGIDGIVKVRLTVLITVVGIILSIVSVVSSVPALAIQIIYGNIFDPMRATPEAVPQLLLIPAELLQLFISSIFAPLYVVFQTFFYVDMRVRREGLDLELKLEPQA